MRNSSSVWRLRRQKLVTISKNLGVLGRGDRESAPIALNKPSKTHIGWKRVHLIHFMQILVNKCLYLHIRNNDLHFV